MNDGGYSMKQQRMFGVLIIAGHWIAAVWHLFLAAKVVPSTGDNVSWLAIALFTIVHSCILIAWWKCSDRLAGLFLSAFLFVALGFGAYEHFLSSDANNIFLIAPGSEAGAFRASVFVLMVLEIAGCWVSFSVSLRDSI